MKEFFTNQQIVNILGDLASSDAKAFFDKKIPVKISYALQYSMNHLKQAYDSYESTLTNMINSYHIESVDNLHSEDPQEEEEFKEQLTSLLTEGSEVEIKTITYDDLEKCGNPPYDALTVKEVELLTWLIEED